MSWLSGTDVAAGDVSILARAARAAYAGEPLPSGWSVIAPSQLGIPQDGAYFTTLLGGGSAIVLKNGNSLILSFTGTDHLLTSDLSDYPQLFFDASNPLSYIHSFNSLLLALANYISELAVLGISTSLYVTGHSLGAGAVNQLADISSTEFGGIYSSASFVSFAPPIISNLNTSISIGFENDPVFQAVHYVSHPFSDRPDNITSTDNLVWASSEYLAGNDGSLLPPVSNQYAHAIDNYIYASDRLLHSSFYNLIAQDSRIIFVATDEQAWDREADRNIFTFFLGRDANDRIIGGSGVDFFEVGAGNDLIDGRDGLFDTAQFQLAYDRYVIERHGSTLTVTGRFSTDLAADGRDSLSNIEFLRFADRTIAVSELLDLSAGTAPGGNATDGGIRPVDGPSENEAVGSNTTGETIFGDGAPNHLNGTARSDLLCGNGGDDILTGYGGQDTFDGGLGKDTVDYSYEPANVSGTVSLAAGSAFFPGFYTEQLISIENVWMGAGNDHVYGDDGPNDLRAGPGDDILWGGLGNDVIYGDWKYSDQNGNDTAILSYTFGAGYTVSGSAKALHIVGAEGDDWYYNVENFLFAGGATQTATAVLTRKDYSYSIIDNPIAYGGSGNGTFAQGINDAGSIIGYYVGEDRRFHGFLYGGGSYSAIDFNNSHSINHTYARSINNLGGIVGQLNYYDGHAGGFLYNPGFTSINDPSSDFHTVAYGLNDAGEIVGSYTNGDHWSGFLYSAGTYITLNHPSATRSTYPFDINAVGQIVGSYEGLDNYEHGFLYSGGLYLTVDVPSATSTVAMGINDWGDIVGVYVDGTGKHSFLYSGGAFNTLDHPFDEAHGINNAGQIAGTYTDSSGAHGFLATPQFPAFIPDAQTIERASIAADGTEANELTYVLSISADGRYVAFQSSASNLVGGDANINSGNSAHDIFVRDRTSHTTQRVSVASDGTEGNNDSREPTISADGRYVAFDSYASNLVAGDANVSQDVFVYDRITHTTERVSIASDGTDGNRWSADPSISADGRFVSFTSLAFNLVDDHDDAVSPDIFVYDRVTHTTERVSVASDGIGGNNTSLGSSISAGGRYITFASFASNLVAGDSNAVLDIFVHDRETNTTQRVSVASDGTQGGNYSADPSISADGRFVVFRSGAGNLVANDTNGVDDIFIHDRIAHTTQRVSVAGDGTQANNQSYNSWISADGRYVAFGSYASNLVVGDTNSAGDIFIYDRTAHTTQRISVASDGTEGNYDSSYPSTSADGQYVAFSSLASNLIAGDTNAEGDGFVVNRKPNPKVSAQADVVVTNEDSTYAGNVLFDNGNEADSGHQIFVLAINGLTQYVGDTITLASGALLIVNPDGRFVYDPNGKFQSLGVGQSATDSFGYTISDRQDHTDTAGVTITINGAVHGLRINDGSGTLDGTATDDQIAGGSGNETIHGGAGYDWLQGGAGADQLHGDDGSDALFGDDGDDILFGGSGYNTLDGGANNDTATFFGARAQYQVTLLSNGDIQISDQRAGAPDGIGTIRNVEKFAFLDGTFTAATVLTNAPVVAYPIADQVTVEDQRWSFIVAATGFADINGDTLSYTATLGDGGALPSWLTFTAATGTFSGAPPRDFYGLLNLRITASDGLLSAFDEFALTITPVNDAPVALDDAASGSEDTEIGGTLVATDVDNTAAHLTYALVGEAAHGTATVNANGAFSYTPNADFNGTDWFTFRVSDGALNSNTVTLTLTVDPVPDAPVITSNGGGDTVGISTVENATAVTVVSAADPDAGALLAYSIVGGADQAKFQINPSTGVLSFIAAPDFETPADADQNNSYIVQVRVSDGSLFDSQTIAVNVLDVSFNDGGLGPDSLTGGPGDDVLDGQGGDDSIAGGPGDDTISGGLGDDVLDGGVGADRMAGGPGDDNYIVDNIGDQISENANEGYDVVLAGISYTLPANVEQVVLTGTADLNAVANSLDDTLVGNAGNNHFTVGHGTDIILGRAGIDTVVFSGNRSDYAISLDGETQRFTITDVRSGSPDGVAIVSEVEFFRFSDGTVDATSFATPTVTNPDSTKSVTTYDTGNLYPWSSTVSTYDASGHRAVQTYNEDNGTVWTNAYDTNNTHGWTWSTSNYDASGDLLSLTITYDDGTHSLTAHDAAGTNAWSDLSVVFDASWSVTSESGTHHDGSALAAAEIGSALDAVSWYIQPVDPVRDFALPSAVYLAPKIETPGLPNVAGDTGNNTISGGPADDTLDAGAGADTMAGGLGNDTYVADNVGDQILENANEGYDTVFAGISYTLPPNVEQVTLTGMGDLNAVANALDDTLVGNAGDNQFTVGSGIDIIAGGDGDDTVVFSGDLADYAISWDGTDTQSFAVSDLRSGSPDGLSIISDVESLKFVDGTVKTISLISPTVSNSDGTHTVTTSDTSNVYPWSSTVSTYDAADRLAVQTYNEDNGTVWTNTYDTNNAFNWAWSTSESDAFGNLISRTTTYDIGTHSLSGHGNADITDWSEFTVILDAAWNIISQSGTYFDGTALTIGDIASALDTISWYTYPVDPARDFIL
jgi:VCBS repeat-containing protein